MRSILAFFMFAVLTFGWISFAQEKPDEDWHLKYLEMKAHALQVNKDMLFWERLYHVERSQSIQDLFIPQVEKEQEKVQKELEELKNEQLGAKISEDNSSLQGEPVPPE